MFLVSKNFAKLGSGSYGTLEKKFIQIYIVKEGNEFCLNIL